MTEFNPYEAPAARIEPEVFGSGPYPAGRAQRLLAVIFDTMLNLAAASPIWLPRGWHTTGTLTNPLALVKLFSETGFSETDGIGIGLLLGLWGYQGYRYANTGQTLGKKWVGIRVVRPDGRKVGPLRLLGLREGFACFLRIIPVVGSLLYTMDALSIFRSNRRTIHDEIADTIVIQS